MTSPESDETTDPASEPRIVPRSEHSISRQNISENALKVLYRLHNKGGHKAYLVGGSVRDLLLETEPKDYDVGTDARPPQIRALFNNSRIIGRRFRLAHIMFRGETIECSTFRGAPDPARQQSPEDDLLVTSDNTYGTPREDAFRRDFTINALFYDIADFSVIDYVGGIDDLKRRIVRVIGDPDVRFQEDPVRMMRACEFAGRLGFGIDPATQESIQRHRSRLELAAPARVTEEILQLMRCGASGAAMQWMLELGLLEVLLPEVYSMIGSGAAGVRDFTRLLPTLDRLVSEGRTYDDAVLLGLLLLPHILQRRDDVEAVDARPMSRSALHALVHEIAEPFAARFQLSNKRTAFTHRALTGFFRLCEPGWEFPEQVGFARRPYFEDGLGLFEILVETTLEGRDVLETWRRAAARAGRDTSPAKRGERRDGDRPRDRERGGREGHGRRGRTRKGRSGRR